MKYLRAASDIVQADICRTQVVCLVPRPRADFRIFCFHHAGGAASFFRHWPGLVPTNVEICCVQQPGREKLFLEPRYSTFEQLLDNTLGAIIPMFDRPFAFFGHSFGALVAYTCALNLERLNLMIPQNIFLSSFRAIDLPSKFELHSTMSDTALVKKLTALGGMPAEIADSPAFLELYLSVLRGDMHLIEQFEAGGGRALMPIAVPLTVFGGDEDFSTPREEIVQWARFTTKKFSAHFFPGQHFYIMQHARAICDIIEKEVNSMKWL